jgi:hypothetical protein
MIGAVLGGLQLGATVLGAIAVPFAVFNPGWCVSVNAVIQIRRIES